MSYRDTPDDNYFRRLLSNAVESDMQSGEEIECLRKYKRTLHQLKREKKELSKIKKRLNELYSEGSTANTDDITDLEETAHDIETLVSHYEKYLLKLETTHPLRKVIERESVKAYLAQQEKEVEEILKRNDEQRQEALKRKAEQEAKRTAPVNEPSIETTLKPVLLNQFLMSLSLTYPLIMLETPFLLILAEITLIFLPSILILLSESEWLPILSFYIVYHLYNIIRPILYVCGLVATIQGQQDFVAVAFYILMGLQAVNIIKRFFGTVIMIIQLLTINKE